MQNTTSLDFEVAPSNPKKSDQNLINGMDVSKKAKVKLDLS
jgi:hypothetical protein